MSEWGWSQQLEQKLQESEFLKENKLGAKIGETVGAAAGVAAVACGVLYAGSAAAASASAAATSHAAAMAVATPAVAAASERAYRAGFWVGKQAASRGLKNTAKAAFTLGRFGGAYIGATNQAVLRELGEELRDLFA
ncbi:hypothetical protein OG429_40015 [Streptomyces sp. NBC_00190]|uniref:hypothetical protein n=1 Tax=Streptomyces sp. NBC_00190 TaxID=2903634 RepID=UPI002E291B88|nr:hypothetical protein [Streptomyces sp. NBC_00190]